MKYMSNAEYTIAKEEAKKGLASDTTEALVEILTAFAFSYVLNEDEDKRNEASLNMEAIKEMLIERTKE